MADPYKRPYLDANVYISLIKNETIDGVQCAPIVEQILQEAERGQYKIGISALIIAEVHKVKGHSQITNEQDDYFISFFQRAIFDLIEVDRDIAESANRHCRQFGLYPNDAIHLASAIRLGCDFLLSWDDDFKNVPHSLIRCAKPEMQGQLPLQENT